MVARRLLGALRGQRDCRLVALRLTRKGECLLDRLAGQSIAGLTEGLLPAKSLSRVTHKTDKRNMEIQCRR